jgi:hypothetical protein
MKFVREIYLGICERIVMSSKPRRAAEGSYTAQDDIYALSKSVKLVMRCPGHKWYVEKGVEHDLILQSGARLRERLC